MAEYENFEGTGVPGRNRTIRTIEKDAPNGVAGLNGSGELDPSVLPAESYRDNYVLVKSASDLPAPSGGLITLADNTVYELNGLIDIGSDRIKMGSSSVIVGRDKTDDGLISTTLSSTIVATNASFTVKNIFIASPGGPAISCSGDGTNIAEIAEVVFTGGGGTSFTCTGGMDVVVFRNNLITLKSGGVQFIGTNGEIIIVDNIFKDGNAGLLSYIFMPSGEFETGIIHRNFFDVVNVPSTQVAIDIDLDVNITSGLIIQANTFVGAGTYLEGIDASTNDVYIPVDSNKGIAGLRRLEPLAFVTSTYATTSADFVNTPVASSLILQDTSLYQLNSTKLKSGFFEVSVNHDQAGETLSVCIADASFNILGFGMDDKFTISNITYQGNGITRYEFDGTEGITGFEPFDLARIQVGETATFEGCTNASNNGTYTIQAINDGGTKYVDVFNPNRTDGTDDEVGSPGLSWGGSVVYVTVAAAATYETALIPSVFVQPNTDYRVGLRRYSNSGGNPSVRVSNTNNKGYIAPINF